MGENNIKPKQEAGEAMSIKVKDQSGGEVGGPGSGALSCSRVGCLLLLTAAPCQTAHHTGKNPTGAASCGGWGAAQRASQQRHGGAVTRGGPLRFRNAEEAWQPTCLHLLL